MHYRQELAQDRSRPFTLDFDPLGVKTELSRNPHRLRAAGATGNSCNILRRMGTRASRRCRSAVIVTAVNYLRAGRQQPSTAGTVVFHYLRSHPEPPEAKTVVVMMDILTSPFPTY